MEKYSSARHSADDNVAQEHTCCVPQATDTIIRIWNNYCCSTATMVARKRLIVTL